MSIDSRLLDILVCPATKVPVKRLPKDKLASCYVWCAIPAMVGSRHLYIVTNLEEFADGSFLDLVNVRKGGLVAYGGFLGGFLGSWVYLRRVKLRLMPWADIVVPTLASGLGITRIGCFLYGCDYGKPIPDDAPGWIKALGLSFPNWADRFPHHVEQFKNNVGCMSGDFTGSPAWKINHVNSFGEAAVFKILVLRNTFDKPYVFATP